MDSGGSWEVGKILGILVGGILVLIKTSYMSTNNVLLVLDKQFRTDCQGIENSRM
jgi:hypothetical protein